MRSQASDVGALAAGLGLVPIGGQIAGPFTSLPVVRGAVFDWADGGLIDRSTYAAFFAFAGHSYNGGVDPGSNKVRKPDKRGRVCVGADSFGQGPAGRIPNSNRTLGANGGEERHALTGAENGPHTHALDRAVWWNGAPLDGYSQVGASTQRPEGLTTPNTVSSGSGTPHNVKLDEDGAVESQVVGHLDDRRPDEEVAAEQRGAIFSALLDRELADPGPLADATRAVTSMPGIGAVLAEEGEPA